MNRGLFPVQNAQLQNGERQERLPCNGLSVGNLWVEWDEVSVKHGVDQSNLTEPTASTMAEWRVGSLARWHLSVDCPGGELREKQ